MRLYMNIPAAMRMTRSVSSRANACWMAARRSSSSSSRRPIHARLWAPRTPSHDASASSAKNSAWRSRRLSEHSGDRSPAPYCRIVSSIRKEVRVPRGWRSAATWPRGPRATRGRRTPRQGGRPARGVTVEAPGEDGQVNEEGLLCSVQEVVAPLHDPPEGAVSIAILSAPGREQGEPLIEAVFDLGRGHRDGSSRGELDGESQQLRRGQIRPTTSSSATSALNDR